MKLDVVDHPGLVLEAIEHTLPRPLGELPSPGWLVALLRSDAVAPVHAPPDLRAAVRDLLRGHGYRPTGRGKPSSEYLAGAAERSALGSINAVVDAGNAASLHSGLPISVVDLDRCRPPLRVAVAGAGTSYVFNRSGQTIDVSGLLCLFDADGPCANAVKDAQRTKTDATTRRILAIVWGTDAAAPGHTARTTAWLRALLLGVPNPVHPSHLA